MFAGTGSDMPRVFLDTCVISGHVKQDMRPPDQVAFDQLAGLVGESRLTFAASTVAREEIDRIPLQWRASHEREYETLRIVRGSDATWIDDHPGSTGFGDVVEHPQYAKLRSILRDEGDARQLFQAWASGFTDAITVDYKSILNKAQQLEQEAGIRVFSPAQYLASLST